MIVQYVYYFWESLLLIMEITTGAVTQEISDEALLCFRNYFRFCSYFLFCGVDFWTFNFALHRGCRCFSVVPCDALVPPQRLNGHKITYCLLVVEIRKLAAAHLLDYTCESTSKNKVD